MNEPFSPFRSFWMGGFECSTHRLRSGRRVDVIDATAHDRLAAGDYAALQSLGLGTVRDGLRWPLIERRPGEYDFSSAEAQVRAAQASGVQVIWDLMHYGYPDFLDPYSPDFAPAFAAYAQAAGEFLARHTDGPLWVCPVNEISFFAWAGGEVGDFAPFAQGRGHELKRKLAGAAIAGAWALRRALPQVRFLLAEPLIGVHRHPERPQEWTEADGFHASQFEALEMLLGRLYPELGGSPELVDMLGLNYYPVNQWVHHSDHGRRRVLEPADPEYRPLHELLADVHRRYGLPMILAETGTEGAARAAWLRWVAHQALTARARGVPLLGLCLYPVVNHPGWVDDRHCPNGLLDYPGTAPGPGGRAADPALAAALLEVQAWERGEWPAQAPLLPSEPLPLGAVLDRLALAAPTLLAEAPLRHADGGFPAKSFAALRRHGLLRATLPGGLGYGLGGPQVLHLLRAVGRLSLPVARLYEGHLNALRLLARYGSPK
ncbi:MAG: glycosyl transferase family 1, partial [Deinococcus sp.]|nr:glycosyl transferase family 1 [Deinococcus sp.]